MRKSLPSVRPTEAVVAARVRRPPARWRALGGLLVALGMSKKVLAPPRLERSSPLPASIPAIIEVQLESVFSGAVIAYTKVNAVRGERL